MTVLVHQSSLELPGHAAGRPVTGTAPLLLSHTHQTSLYRQSAWPKEAVLQFLLHWSKEASKQHSQNQALRPDFRSAQRF